MPPKKIPEAQRNLNWLYDLYRKYNKKYFGGKLPNEVLIQIVAAGTKGYSIDCNLNKATFEEGCTTIFSNEAPPVVELHEYMLSYPPYAKGVLLHEQIHVSGITGHGKEFNAECDRIGKLGATRELLK